MTKFEEYVQEYMEFTKINDLNLEQRVMRVPAEKHCWVERLILAKKEKYKLLLTKKKTKETLTKKMIEGGIVNLSKQTLDSLENTETMEEINERLQELEHLIEFLELTVKNITFIGNDIKNILELKRMQME